MFKPILKKITITAIATLFLGQSLFANKTIDDLFTENKITKNGIISYGAEKYVFDVTIGKQRLACLYFNPTLYNNSKYYMKELTFLKEAEKIKNENPGKITNIIEYKGFLVEDYNYSIFTELAESDLNNYIFEPNLKYPKDLKTKIKFIIDIAIGIKYMHDQGYVHRDIKAKNVVIKDAKAKLIDFTMYKKIPVEQDYIYTKRIKGSMDYICPEHIISQSRKKRLKVERVNDIYSFGVLIYSLLYEKYFDEDLRKELFKDEYEQEERIFENIEKRFNNPEYRLAYLNNWINKKWRPILDETVPEKLNALIKECWNHKPTNRPSINFILDQLIEIKEQLFQESEEI